MKANRPIPPSRLHRKPPCALSRERRRRVMLARSAAFRAQGLTWNGKPRRYSRRDDLEHLRGDLRAYRKEHARLWRQWHRS